MRRTAITFGVLTIACAGLAEAQTGGTGGTDGTGGTGGTSGSLFTKADFTLRLKRRQGDAFIYALDQEVTLSLLNRARCECKEPIQISVELTSTGLAKRSTITKSNIRLLVGQAECLSSNLDSRSRAKCTELGHNNLADLALKNPWLVDTSVDVLFANGPLTSGVGTDCTADFQQQVMLWVDAGTTLDLTPDLTDSNAPSLALPLDGEAPEAPTGIAVTGGNGALRVSWDSLNLVSDFNGYVVFCSRAGTYQVFDPSYYDSRSYQNPSTLCPGGPFAASTDGGATDARTNDAGVTEAGAIAAISNALVTPAASGTAVPAPQVFRDLDPRFVCADFLTGGGSARITGLENGIPYVVGVATVDKHGNAGPISEGYLQNPIPTRDFYRAYREAGGEDQGGYCAYGDGPRRRNRALGLGVLGVALLLGRRWRRRSRA